MTSKTDLILRSRKGKRELLKSYVERQKAENKVKEIKKGWVSKILSKLKNAEVAE